MNIPGGNGVIAEERSSAKAVEEIAANPITAKRVLLTMRTSLFLPDACSHRYASMWVRSVCEKRRHAAAFTLAEGACSRMVTLRFRVVSTNWRRPVCRSNVRVGSLADIRSELRMSALPPKAEMLSVGIDVC